MPYFKHKFKPITLLINFKVGLSTMSCNDNYTRLGIRKMILYTSLDYVPLYRSNQYYLIVRNPYNRLISFYKDKFINHPLNFEKSNIPWQGCQKLFIPDSLIKKGDDAEIAQFLINYPFNNFIKRLPQVYLCDGHLTPQAHIEIVKYKIMKFQLSIKDIFKLESDLERMENVLDFDINTRRNDTSWIKLEHKWADEEIRIVNELYEEDFEKYGYVKM